MIRYRATVNMGLASMLRIRRPTWAGFVDYVKKRSKPVLTVHPCMTTKIGANLPGQTQKTPQEVNHLLAGLVSHRSSAFWALSFRFNRHGSTMDRSLVGLQWLIRGPEVRPVTRSFGWRPGSSYDLIHHNCLSFCNAPWRMRDL